MYIEVIKQSDDLLNIVPDEYKNYAKHIIAIEQDANKFNNVPKEILTSEFCLAAVKANPLVIDYIPKELQTADMFKLVKASIERNQNASAILNTTDEIDNISENTHQDDTTKKSVK